MHSFHVISLLRRSLPFDINFLTKNSFQRLDLQHLTFKFICLPIPFPKPTLSYYELLYSPASSCLLILLLFPQIHSTYPYSMGFILNPFFSSCLDRPSNPPKPLPFWDTDVVSQTNIWLQLTVYKTHISFNSPNPEKFMYLL